MELQSQPTTLQRSAADVYQHLSTSFEHYRDIMPDEVEHFAFDDTSFVFGLKGLPHIRLIGKDQIQDESITLTAASSKLDFDLTLHLKALDEKSCEAHFIFHGAFNPMMQMMIQKPLQQFIEKLTQKMTSHFAQ